MMGLSGEDAAEPPQRHDDDRFAERDEHVGAAHPRFVAGGRHMLAHGQQYIREGGIGGIGGGWKRELEAGSWKLEAGSWKPETKLSASRGRCRRDTRDRGSG